MTREVDRLRLRAAMSATIRQHTTPRIEAAARAKWEAEVAFTGCAGLTQPPGCSRHLATARSVAGRSAGAWTDEPSLEDKQPTCIGNGNGAMVKRFEVKRANLP